MHYHLAAGHIVKNSQHFSVNIKQANTARYVKLKALLTRFREVTAAGVNVDGKVLSLGTKNSQTSGGWLHRFKQRHRFGFRTLCGEGEKVDESAVGDWIDSLLVLISGYAPHYIFNGDETDIFNLQPGKS